MKLLISTSTSKPPLFSYVIFIKNLSVYDINQEVQSIIGFNDNKYMVVLQEIFKVFMNQISLTILDFLYSSSSPCTSFSDIPFTTYPKAIDGLSNL